MRVKRLLAGLAVAALAVVAAGCGKDPLEIPPEGPTAEWDKAYGPYADNPRGVLILIHGGGWKGIDRNQFNVTREQGEIYTRMGFMTMTIDYRAGADGLKDVERFYKQARKRVGKDVPICAVGSSAGGHLALMLAAREPSLDCAVSIAGPTNLAGLADQEGGEQTYKIASDAFGEENLEKLSPVLHADKIKAKIFVAGADNDPLMPVDQLKDIEKAVPGTKTVVLPAGESPWVHSAVEPSAKKRMNQELSEFLNAVAPLPSPAA